VFFLLRAPFRMSFAERHPTIEALEPRRLLSAWGGLPNSAPSRTSPAAHTVQRHRRAAAPKSYLISFYGLGGGGFGNDQLSKLATAAGKADGASVRKYQQTDGTTALQNLLHAMDTNHDHTISTAEINNASVRVVGYSFGAIQAANFTRSLDSTGTIAGCTLAAPIPIQTLVTIDPVNYTPLKHTDGVLGNVRNFVNYYELNPSAATLQLASKKGGKPAGTATFSDTINPIGGTLTTFAVASQQTLVSGTWANRSVTRPFNSKSNGTLTGSGVNHTTMPWYLYDDVLTNLTA
jgi:hypothetical protein